MVTTAIFHGIKKTAQIQQNRLLDEVRCEINSLLSLACIKVNITMSLDPPESYFHWYLRKNLSIDICSDNPGSRRTHTSAVGVFKYITSRLFVQLVVYILFYFLPFCQKKIRSSLHVQCT